MLDITMNFDISARLTPQRSTIICHGIKYIIKRKNKGYKTMGVLGQTHSKKRRQRLTNQAKQNETRELIPIVKKSNLITTGKTSYHVKSNLFLRPSEASLSAQYFPSQTM